MCRLTVLLKPAFLSKILNSHRQHVGLEGRIHAFQFSTLLTGEARASSLRKLSANGGPFTWIEDPSGRNSITKTFQFTDFAQAWQWMSQVATLAEEMNHHPEWKNIYNVVEVTLSTHDCGGLSELDIKMAEQMDTFAANILPTRDSQPSK